MINSIPGITPISSPARYFRGWKQSARRVSKKCSEGTIGTMESLNSNAGTAVQNFLSGQNEDLHTTILATQQAEMAFELGLQVRNKVVSAYQEIMKMQL